MRQTFFSFSCVTPFFLTRMSRENGKTIESRKLSFSCPHFSEGLISTAHFFSTPFLQFFLTIENCVALGLFLLPLGLAFGDHRSGFPNLSLSSHGSYKIDIKLENFLRRNRSRLMFSKFFQRAVGTVFNICLLDLPLHEAVFLIDKWEPCGFRKTDEKRPLFPIRVLTAN